MTIVLVVAGVAGVAILLLLVASRLLFLAPSPLGWLMYLANVVMETFEKRSRHGRALPEAALLLIACGLLGFTFASAAVALAIAAAYLLLVLQNLLRERAVLREVRAAQETVGLQRTTRAEPGFPSPGLHPKLSVNLEGPFVARVPEYHLGLLAADAPFDLEVLVGNHSRVPCQTPVRVSLEAPPGWRLEGAPQRELPPIRSGGVERLHWRLVPAASAGACTLRLRVSASRFERMVEIRASGARRIGSGEIASAAVTRYPGARRSAFSWRGDMDLYDTATFQTIEGLEDAFGLGARYGIAQTMYLSTRLSLDREAAAAWAAHYGVERGADEIPAFIRWMRERVELRHAAPYPARSDRPFVIELGNHGHLHYATDTAGDPGNDWTAGTRAGRGRYPWQGDDHSSFGDQRDNAREAARWCETLFGFTPRSWAKPGRGNDAFSARAMEAAGCEVVTGSDIRARDNVLRQPPPHHPTGTKVCELTARYPSDPQHVQHLAMLEFWIHRAHRLGIPVVVLVHQHIRQWDGLICWALTEHLLDLAVNGFHGDLAIDTVYGIGRYWLDVLSPETRRVEVAVAGDAVVATNRTDRTIHGVPIDLALRDGSRLTRVVDLAPGETRLHLHGEGAKR